MKKILCLLLIFVLTFGLVACSQPDNNGGNNDGSNGDGGNGDGGSTPVVMSYAEYMAAPIDSEVTVEAYVQAHQSWWSNKITVYAADEDGAYFFYNMVCSEEDAAKLVPGTKIRVSGVKTSYQGEIELAEGCTFEFAADETDTYIAPAVDLSDKLGTSDVINYQNQRANFGRLILVNKEYKNGEPGDDIYLTFSNGKMEFSFCVEVYLTGTESEVYQAAVALNVNDVVDVEGFVYWYAGMNPHVTKLTKVEVLSYDEYMNAPVDADVTVTAYVQAHQSWWSNKITVYAADEDGAYFFYNMVCSEEDAAALLPGTKIIVSGVKASYQGEIELAEGCTFMFAPDETDTYTSTAVDLTAKIDTAELILHQNQKAAFKGLEIVSIEYKNGAPGDDIYITVTNGTSNMEFCVEIYLTGETSEVYTTVATLQAGDIVDIQCFLYWYNGPNPHITAISEAAQ